MERFDPMPAYIVTALSRRNINQSCIKLVASADLTIDGDFCEAWVVVTNEKIIVLTGEEKDNKLKPSGINARNPGIQENNWNEFEYKEYSIQDIEEIKAENLISTGMLTVKISGEDRIICCYSNTHLRNLE